MLYGCLNENENVPPSFLYKMSLKTKELSHKVSQLFFKILNVLLHFEIYI